MGRMLTQKIERMEEEEKEEKKSVVMA